MSSDGIGGILDYFRQRSEVSGLQDWAKAQSQAGSLDPALADLAQKSPSMFMEIFPKALEKQQEQNAINKAYGLNAQPDTSNQLTPGNLGDIQANAPVPQALPTGEGLQLNPVPAKQTALQRMAGQMAYLPSSLQSVAAQGLMFQGMDDTSGASGQSSGVPSGAHGIAKAMIEGRIPLPSSFALKTPYWQQMMQLAQQIDPQFDATIWAQRNKTVQDFNATGGKSRQNIMSIETAMNHTAALKELSDKAGGVDNAWILNYPLNAAHNAYLGATSDANRNAYNELAKTAADEIARATAGPGGSTESDRKARLEAFSLNNSPEARTEALQTALQMLEGRLEPMAESYNNAMGTAKRPTELLSPNAQSSYMKVMGMQPENATASGNYPSALAQIGQGVTPDMARAELARRAKMRGK